MTAPVSASISLTPWNANKLQQTRAGVLRSVHSTDAGVGRRRTSSRKNPLIKATIRACMNTAFEVLRDRFRKVLGFV